MPGRSNPPTNASLITTCHAPQFQRAMDTSFELLWAQSVGQLKKKKSEPLFLCGFLPRYGDLLPCSAFLMGEARLACLVSKPERDALKAEHLERL